MRNAAANVAPGLVPGIEEAARLRRGIKRLKRLDLEFANEVLTPPPGRRGG